MSVFSSSGFLGRSPHSRYGIHQDNSESHPSSLQCRVFYQVPYQLLLHSHLLLQSGTQYSFLSLERYRLLPLTAVERSSDIPASLLFDNCSLENLAYVRSEPYDVLGLITLGRYNTRAPASGRPGPVLQSAQGPAQCFPQNNKLNLMYLFLRFSFYSLRNEIKHVGTE